MEVYISTRLDLAPSMRELLKREFQVLRGKGVRVVCRERPQGYFRCQMIKGRLFGRRDGRSYRLAIAGAVASMIIREWELFVGRRLFRETQWLDEQDWELIQRRINEDQSLMRGYRDRVLERLMRYLEDNNQLNVDGFVSFRLSDYPDTMGEIMGRILDDFLLEQENREFIGVLQRFARRQEKRPDMVHVVINSSNHFRIYDGQMRVLTRSVEGALATAEDEVRQEDVLISTLVALAPCQVIIHGCCMSATFHTLTEVFPGALRRCSGCKYCPA